jgi:hypothetical protein
MNLKRAIPTCAVTAACALGIVPAASAATDVQQASSENWSGYVVGSSSGKQFTSVSGSWVAPTVTCTSGQSYSAFWVGLGGSGQSSGSSDSAGSGQFGGSGDPTGSGESTTLEQDGTEADCSASGTASSFAWYELVPSAPVRVDLGVHPGDHISSKVTVEGANVTVSLSNQTTGQSFAKTLQTTNPDVSSAEWIAEAPSACDGSVSNCSPLSLADFGTVRFTGVSATTTDGHTGTISDPNWSAAAVSLSPGAADSGFGASQFASQQTSAGATPSALSSDGSSFSVAWSGDAGAAADTSGSAGGGYGGRGYGGGGYGGYGGYGGGGYGYGYGYGGGGYGGGGYIYVPDGYLYG